MGEETVKASEGTPSVKKNVRAVADIQNRIPAPSSIAHLNTTPYRPHVYLYHPL